jgi:hypothetical protein
MLLAIDFIIQTLQERAKQILSVTCMFDKFFADSKKKSADLLNHITTSI